MALWKKIFNNYEVLDSLKANGITTLLAHPDGIEDYIVLFLGRQDREKKLTLDIEQLLSSLCSHTTGDTSYEIQFGELTLNICHIFYPDTVIATNESGIFKNKMIRVLPYGNESFIAKFELPFDDDDLYGYVSTGMGPIILHWAELWLQFANADIRSRKTCAEAACEKGIGIDEA